jgi:DNA-binding transcriptional LysR family regulator
LTYSAVVLHLDIPHKPGTALDEVALTSVSVRIKAAPSNGTLLGWHHLVHRQVDQGTLVRPVRDAIVFHDRHHYLITHKNAKSRPEYQKFIQWVTAEVDEMMKDWPKATGGSA